jgi:predicted Zn-dependent protease
MNPSSRFYSNLGIWVHPVMVMILAGTIGILSCARNPVSGRPDAVLMTEKGEIEQGDEAAKQVEGEIGFSSDAELNEYVRSVGQRLAAHSPRANLEHHFYVLNMTEPNAFALPGGHIYISRGILALMNSEDELANVIGHEIGHVAARHSVTRQAASAPLIPLKIAAGIGGALTSIVAPRVGQLISGAGQLPGVFALAAYSREQEREADSLGQQYAAAAGWDPRGLSSFMHTLGRDAALHDSGDHRIHFLDSHPPSPERSEAAKKYSKELEITQDVPNILPKVDFLGRIDGLIVGPRAEDGVFIESQFLHADMGFGLSFPEAWTYQNSLSAVMAVSDSGNAYVAVALDDPKYQPIDHAEALGETVKLRKEPKAFEINGLPAARVVVDDTNSRREPSVMRITWIASQGMIYRIVGAATASVFPDVVGPLRAAANSFHELSDDELAEIQEYRLRIELAHKDDALEAIAERSGEHWGAEVMAIANGLEVDARLTPGQLIKVTRQEHYEAKAPVEPEPEADAEHDTEPKAEPQDD